MPNLEAKSQAFFQVVVIPDFPYIQSHPRGGCCRTLLVSLVNTYVLREIYFCPHVVLASTISILLCIIYQHEYFIVCHLRGKISTTADAHIYKCRKETKGIRKKFRRNKILIYHDFYDLCLHPRYIASLPIHWIMSMSNQFHQSFAVCVLWLCGKCH